MKRSSRFLFLFCLLLASAQAEALDTNRIEQLTGLKAAWNAAEGVFKVSAPRTDVAVKVDECGQVGPMKTLATVILAAGLSQVTLAGTINFDDAPIGQSPAGWTATKTGRGTPKWTVEQEDSAPSKSKVLKQSGEATYPVCIKDDSSLKDGFVEVRFKPVSGKEDQAGGVVWRAKDADNYYIARANALEDNVTIYHTVKGKRTEKKRTEMKVASGQWHTLRVDFSVNHFTVTFDGKKAIEWDDETFTDAGMVGVWTKADSVTLFDDFTYGTK